jgi:CRP-like cAMP-binding protein
VRYGPGWPGSEGTGEKRDLKLAIAHRMDLLAGAPLFAGLNKRQLGEIARATTTVTGEAGSQIMREGSPARFCCVIVSGEVDVLKGVRPIARIGPGEMVGEIALLDPGPRSATVVAVTDVLAIRLARAAFVEVVTKDPKILLRMVESMARRLRAVSEATLT